MKNIQEWARSVHHEVNAKWKEFQERSEGFESGYAVFYSPVRMEPSLMIIGYNPGGTAADFDPHRAAVIPEQHEYVLEHYRLAKKMRELFGNAGSNRLLSESVKTNLIFFRTSSAHDWERINPIIRKNAEDFCFSKTKEIIQTLKPRRILAEGIRTYSLLRKILRITGNEDAIISQGRSLVKQCSGSGIDLIGMIHPTGARMNTKEWSLVQKEMGRRVS